MEEKNIEYLKEINKALIKKMGLAKKHLKDIEKEIVEAKSKKPLITKNKHLSDKEKKTKMSELMASSFNKISYHVKLLDAHIFNDEHSLKKYLINNAEQLKSEKESQLDGALEMGFITADQAEERREKWKEQQKRKIDLMESKE